MNTSSILHQAASPKASQREVLVFNIGSEEYGVDIALVRELRGYDAVTRIANAPEHIKGVVNLRGRIVPIVDLRVKLGIANPSYDPFTVVVMLDISSTAVGMVVDSVSDVTTLTDEQIKPAPDCGTGGAPYVLGVATLGERMLILVDIARMLSLQIRTDLNQLAA